jgi:hypothetical protein
MTSVNARIRRLAAGAVIVVSLAACGSAAAPTPSPANAATGSAFEFGIKTAARQPDACMDALLGGTLARHPQSGLGVVNDGEQMPVEWPFRYSARIVEGRVILFDETGKPVAAEGDEITVGGGFGNQFWHACAPVNRAAN